MRTDWFMHINVFTIDTWKFDGNLLILNVNVKYKGKLLRRAIGIKNHEIKNDFRGNLMKTRTTLDKTKLSAK